MSDTLVLETPNSADAAPNKARRLRRPVPSGQCAGLLTAAAFVGLVTGCCEVVYFFCKKFVLGRLLFLPMNVFWMSPLVHLALFGVVGVLLVLAARRVRHPSFLSFGVTVLSFFAWFNLSLLIPNLHVLANLMLAGGLATATGSWFEKNSALGLKWMRRGSIVLADLVFAIAVVEFMTSTAENEPLSSAPAAGNAPNVLLVMLDTVRADALGMYDSRRDVSPNMDALVERGVVFERALSTAPWTLPSTAGMMTGRLPHELSVGWDAALDDRFPTLAEQLQRAGYDTAGFVANTNYCNRETGLARGFGHYEDYQWSWSQLASCTAMGRKLLLSLWLPSRGFYDLPGRISAADINRRFVNWLDDRPHDRPYFAFVNYFDAHDPYVAPGKFHEHAPADKFERLMVRYWWSMDKAGLSEDQVAFLRDAYDDCLRYLDDQLGRLFRELEQRGELDNTIVVLTSDHGEHFGEHDLLLHGNSLYQPLVHVPLAVVWPGHVPDGVRVRETVSLGRLPATIAELTNAGDREVFPMQSLAPSWNDSSNALLLSPVFSEIKEAEPGCPPCQGRSPVARGAMRSVVLDGFKYVLNGDGVEELYNLDADPVEEHNLVDDATFADTLTRLRETLRQALGERGTS